MSRGAVVVAAVQVVALEPMLRANMLPPLGDDEESAVAQRADVRVLVGVDADLVALHVAQVAEAQRAAWTLVGALTRVRP